MMRYHPNYFTNLKNVFSKASSIKTNKCGVHTVTSISYGITPLTSSDTMNRQLFKTLISTQHGHNLDPQHQLT